MPRRLIFWLLALLILEYLSLSFAVDARVGAPWPLLGHAGWAAAYAATAITASLLIFGARRQLLEIGPVKMGWLVPHLFFFGLLFGLTYLGFGTSIPKELRGLWLAGWLFAGLASGLSWFLASGIRLQRRAFIAPLFISLLIGALAFWAGQQSSALWPYAAGLTLSAAELLLRFINAELIVEPETLLLGIRDFHVIVAPACSGLEGMGLIAVFLSAYLFAFRRQLRPTAIFMLPLSIGLMWVGNVFRICALLLVGAHLSQEAAVSGFHSKAGWVLFCGLALLMAYLTRRWFSSAETSAAPDEDRYIIPLLTVISISMVVGLFSPTPSKLYPLQMLGGAAALLWVWRRHLPKHFMPTKKSVALGVLAYLLWTMLKDKSAPNSEETVSFIYALLRITGAVLIAPIVEELAFRGFLLRKLGTKLEGKALPLLISSAAFGALHSAWVPAMLTGVLFGVALLQRDKTRDAIWAHSVTNALWVLEALYRGNLDLLN